MSLIVVIVWVAIGLVGFIIFQSKKTPYDLIVGLPMLLVGLGLVFNSLLSAAYALFSPKYNRGVCPLCVRK